MFCYFIFMIHKLHSNSNIKIGSHGLIGCLRFWNKFKIVKLICFTTRQFFIYYLSNNNIYFFCLRINNFDLIFFLQFHYFVVTWVRYVLFSFNELYAFAKFGTPSIIYLNFSNNYANIRNYIYITLIDIYPMYLYKFLLHS